MSEVVQTDKEFTIDSIPEPENIGEVIFSLMVNPNLSSINYFKTTPYFKTKMLAKIFS